MLIVYVFKYLLTDKQSSKEIVLCIINSLQIDWSFTIYLHPTSKTIKWEFCKVYSKVTSTLQVPLVSSTTTLFDYLSKKNLIINYTILDHAKKNHEPTTKPWRNDENKKFKKQTGIFENLLPFIKYFPYLSIWFSTIQQPWDNECMIIVVGF